MYRIPSNTKYRSPCFWKAEGDWSVGMNAVSDPQCRPHYGGVGEGLTLILCWGSAGHGRNQRAETGEGEDFISVGGYTPPSHLSGRSHSAFPPLEIAGLIEMVGVPPYLLLVVQLNGVPEFLFLADSQDDAAAHRRAVPSIDFTVQTAGGMRQLKVRLRPYFSHGSVVTL